MSRPATISRTTAPGSWASPRQDVPTLIAAGDQVHVNREWRTVLGIGSCRVGHDRAFGGVCVVVSLGHGDVHARPGSLLWLRRAVQ